MKFPWLVGFALLVAVILGAPQALAEDVTLEDDAVTLHAELRLADGKSLADGVVVLLHGTLAHNRMEIMQTLQAVLADRGYNSLAVNLGYGVDDRTGMMDCAALHTHRHEDGMRELGLWMDWLKTQNVGPVALMGHSRGGNQVTQYALAHPDAGFEAVILVAPMTYDADKEAAGYEKRYGKPLAGVTQQARGLAASGKGDAVMKGIGFVYCENASATAKAVASYYDPTNKDTPALLGQVKQPVLVFAGTEDTSVPDLVEKMDGVADGDRVKLQVIDGADHFFRDLYAEDIGDAVEAVLGW